MTTNTPTSGAAELAEALRLAAELDDGYPLTGDAISAAAELRRQHTRIAELEAQLSAIGAGGVSPLMAGIDRWVSVDERLPEPNVEVLCAGQGWGNPFVTACYYDDERREWYPTNTRWTDATGGAQYPTHWQPLPAAPSISEGTQMTTPTNTPTIGAADLPEPHFGEGRHLGLAFRSDAYSAAQVQALFASRGQVPALTNLNCKSEQKRLATLWGFVPARADSVTAPAEAMNTKTHELLSTTVGLLMGYREGAARQPYKPGSAIAKVVYEVVDHLKDWPYPEPIPPAQAADPAGDNFGSAAHWKEKAQYWAAATHRMRQEALRGEPVDGIVHPKADSVQEDADRYRWLAAHCRSTSEHWGGRWSIIIDGPAPKSHDSEDDFDAAVDAARKQGGV